MKSVEEENFVVNENLKSKKKKITFANQDGTRQGLNFQVGPVRRLDKKNGPERPKKGNGGWIQPRSRSDYKITKDLIIDKEIELEEISKNSKIKDFEEVFTIAELQESNKAEIESRKEKSEEFEMVNTLGNKKREQRKLTSPGLLTVEARVEGRLSPVLMDSGAKVNCIDSKLLEKLGKEVRGGGRNLVGANNSNLEVLGNVQIRVRFENNMICHGEEEEDFEQEENEINWRTVDRKRRQKMFRKGNGEYLIEFYVVKNLLVPILIGFPSMTEMGAVVNTRESTIALGNKDYEIVMKYETREEEYVCVVEKTTIIPRCTNQQIKIRVDSNQEGLFSLKD